jgi:hypothetical protein
VNPSREELAADFAAIRGTLMCITGDVQKVTVKMSGIGARLPARRTEVSSQNQKAARIVAAASCQKL